MTAASPAVGPDGRHRPILVLVLIAGNILVGIASIIALVLEGDASGESIALDGISPLQEEGELDPEAVRSGELWRVVTTAFVHYGALHLVFNMIMLFFAAWPLERRFGTARFAAVFGVAAIVASLSSMVAAPDALTAGASGAIFGVIGALTVVAVRYRILVRRALLVTVFALATFAMPGMAVAAHIGGWIAGVIVGYALLGPRPEGT